MTVLTGSDLLQSLISSVRFEGVTGLVDFHDASAHPDRIGHGDRRDGVSYVLLNYASNDRGLVAVGSWTPCSSVSCAWDERWQPTGQPLTYSTVDNSRPLQTALPLLEVVRVGVLLPGYTYASWAPHLGWYQALKEINNKTDRVWDSLLPRTQLRFAYYDSKCDATYGLTGALHLANDAFDGAGVSAIVGAGCSGTSVSAAQVAGASGVPLISPSATSPSLSEGRTFPFFLRTTPSDACEADMIQTHAVKSTSI